MNHIASINFAVSEIEKSSLNIQDSLAVVSKLDKIERDVQQLIRILSLRTIAIVTDLVTNANKKGLCTSYEEIELYLEKISACYNSLNTYDKVIDEQFETLKTIFNCQIRNDNVTLLSNKVKYENINRLLLLKYLFEESGSTLHYGIELVQKILKHDLNKVRVRKYYPYNIRSYIRFLHLFDTKSAITKDQVPIDHVRLIDIFMNLIKNEECEATSQYIDAESLIQHSLNGAFDKLHPKKKMIEKTSIVKIIVEQQSQQEIGIIFYKLEVKYPNTYVKKWFTAKGYIDY